MANPDIKIDTAPKVPALFLVNSMRAVAAMETKKLAFNAPMAMISVPREQVAFVSSFPFKHQGGLNKKAFETKILEVIRQKKAHEMCVIDFVKYGYKTNQEGIVLEPGKGTHLAIFCLHYTCTHRHTTYAQIYRAPGKWNMAPWRDLGIVESMSETQSQMLQIPQLMDLHLRQN